MLFSTVHKENFWVFKTLLSTLLLNCPTAFFVNPENQKQSLCKFCDKIFSYYKFLQISQKILNLKRSAAILGKITSEVRVFASKIN